jgi:uncharacterized protein YdbL (DUF1318 family)
MEMIMKCFTALAFVTVAAIVGASTFAAIPAVGAPRAATAQENEMDALKKKFEQRYARIVDLKSNGVVGETSEGYLDWVKGKSEEAAALVDEENADRKTLYALIAKKENTSPDVVAQRNAQRNFEKAKKGDYLKRDGKWIQK